MIHYLFVKIPSLLFEPIAIGGLLGCAVAFLLYRKNHGSFFWMITASICFMLIWRLSAHPLMVSSRYASILLYPAIIFTVCFCYNWEQFCDRFLQYLPAAWNKYKYAKINRYLPYLFMIGLSTVCIVKSLRCNPYSSIPCKIGQAFLEDSKGIENVYYYFINCKEQNRILYYAKLKRSKHQQWYDKIMPTHQLMQKALQDNYNIPGQHYFFVTKEKQEKDFIPTKEVLENGNFTEVSRYFTSHKKKQELILYRYNPFCRNIQEWHGDIPDLSVQNICRNGDFEKNITGKELENRIKYYRKKKVPDFYLESGRLFPQAWWLWINAGQSFLQEMKMTSDHPIAGKYSFSMNGHCGVNQFAVKKQNCTYSGFIRGIIQSTVMVSIYSGNLKTNKSDLMKSSRLFVSPEHIYRFSISVDVKDVPKEYDWIWITVQSEGYILLDQVECIPEYKFMQKKCNCASP